MDKDQKCVFAITEDKQTVLLGIPIAAWEYMKDGKTHTFDLTSLGIPVKIILFGGLDQASIRAVLNPTPDCLDVTGLDFGFGNPE